MDLNSDMGEMPESGIEEALMPFITSANIACGGHAGDKTTIERTVALARRYGVNIGAHPSYPDRENFGRIPLSLTVDQIAAAVRSQIEELATIAEIHHIKPHGALYNVAVTDPTVAEAIALGAEPWRGKTVLVGLAGSVMLDVWRSMGWQVAAEGFADRAYQPDGTLRSRKLPGALITDPDAAAQQALELSSRVDTICIHSDTPGAARIAEAVARRLGLQVR